MKDYLASYKQCALCPHACGVNRREGQRGMCGATDTLRLGRAALHWWEEPCLVGEQGSGAVFFSYCSLRCVYCQNDRLARGEGVEISSARLAEVLLELQNNQHAANINLVTPTHYVPTIASVIEPLRAQGQLTIPVVYNTSGYDSMQALTLMDGLVDIYLTDYKYVNENVARQLSRAPRYPYTIEVAIDEMLKQTGCPVWDDKTGLMQRGVVVRHLVLPGRLKESKQVLKRLYNRWGNQIVLSVMGQYTPLASIAHLADYGLENPLTTEAYEEILDYADDLGFSDYFWQEGGAAKESFIPAFDGTGVV